MHLYLMKLLQAFVIENTIKITQKFFGNLRKKADDFSSILFGLIGFMKVSFMSLSTLCSEEYMAIRKYFPPSIRSGEIHTNLRNPHHAPDKG